MTDEDRIDAALNAVLDSRYAVRTAQLSRDEAAIARANEAFETAYAECQALIDGLSGYSRRGE